MKVHSFTYLLHILVLMLNNKFSESPESPTFRRKSRQLILFSWTGRLYRVADYIIPWMVPVVVVRETK